MTGRRETNTRQDDDALHIVGHRLHKVNAGHGSVHDDIQHAPSAAPRAMRSPQQNRAPTSQAAMRPRQIILVDREIDALRDIAIALRDEYDFHITISGTEALNLLRTGAIDTIVVGQTLYSSTGLNVLAEARRHAPHTHRVLLASAVEATAVESGTAAVEPFKVMQRPCTLDKLRGLLEAKAEEPATAPTSVVQIKAPPVQPAAVQKSTPTLRTHHDSVGSDTRTDLNIQNDFSDHANTHNPADFEHVVMESRPELPQRKSRAASETLNALPVIVYTDNGEFYRTISLALKDRHNVRLCTQLERVIEFAEIGQCPLLITDRAATQVELQRISIAVRAQDSHLIVIAAGTPEIGTALRKFLGTGALHSFLTKPINVPLARLAVESGKRQYLQSKALKQNDLELKPTTTTHAPPPVRQRNTSPVFVPTDFGNFTVDDYDKPTWLRAAPTIAIAALVVLAIAVGGWYWWQQRAAQKNITTSAPTATIGTADEQLAKNLSSGKQAYDAGRYVLPNDDSALFYYGQALKLAPQNATATLGIDATIDRIIEQAEKALLDERLDVAADAIATVRTLQPTNKRLPFLESQLNKERRLAAARESNRATQARATPRSTPMAADANRQDQDYKITPITNETQRLDSVNRWLASAQQRIAQNRLLTPENDSAEYYLRMAERADPDNAAVRKSLKEVGVRLLASARESLLRQQLEQARNLSNDALRFGADAGTVERLQQDIETSASANTRGKFLRLALQRTRENHLFDPERDSAKYYVDQLRSLDPSAPETVQATDALALKLIEHVDQSIAQNQINVATQLLNEVRRLGFNGPELSNADIRLRAARNPSVSASAASRPVAVAPKAIRTAAPKYPDDAERANAEGWVDVGFRITANGDVTEVAAVTHSPSEFSAQFERAAVAAIRQYKYEARNIDDSRTAQRMVVRVQFKLN